MQFLAFVTLVLLSFLSHSSFGASQAVINLATPVPVTPVTPRKCPSCSFSDSSGIKEKLRLVVRDRDAWRELWAKINASVSPSPRLPEIDFSQEMVVIAGLGSRPSGGYGIIIDHVYQEGNQLEIVVVSRSPGPNCAVTLALTAPVDIVRLPRMEDSAVFQEKEMIEECKR